MTTARDDVLVLGAGAVGLACALALTRAGRRVRVLDRGAIGGGSSHGNCGTLTPSHAPPLAAPGMVAQALRWLASPDAPLYIQPRLDPALARWLLAVGLRCNRRDWWASARARAAILHASRAEFERLLPSAGIDCGFKASGLLYVCRTEARLQALLDELPLLAELGITAEPWDGARLRQQEPALQADMAGAIHFPDDAQLRPERYVAGLAAALRAAGGQIDEQVEVTGFRRSGGRVDGVETTRGGLPAGQVVLALGAWSPRVARGLGLCLPMQPGKGYSITWRGHPAPPRRPMVLKERAVCVTAWDDGFRLGSTMEFSGYDERLNRVRLDALVRGAREYLQQPEGRERLEEWYGWRPMAVDDVPLIGRAPGLDNVWLATGHGMLGVTMSPATGRLLSELVTGAAPHIDPVPYDPARFR